MLETEFSEYYSKNHAKKQAGYERPKYKTRAEEFLGTEQAFQYDMAFISDFWLVKRKFLEQENKTAEQKETFQKQEMLFEKMAEIAVVHKAFLDEYVNGGLLSGNMSAIESRFKALMLQLGEYEQLWDLYGRVITGELIVELRGFAINPVQHATRFHMKTEAWLEDRRIVHSDRSKIEYFLKLAKKCGDNNNEAMRLDKHLLTKEMGRIKVQIKTQSNQIIDELQIQASLPTGWQITHKKRDENKGKFFIARHQLDSLFNKLSHYFRKRKEFVVKDAKGKSGFKIYVYPHHIKIRGLKGEKQLRYECLKQLGNLQKIVSSLRGENLPTPPQILSVDPDVNSHMLGRYGYQIGNEGKQVIQEYTQKIKAIVRSGKVLSIHLFKEKGLVCSISNIEKGDSPAVIERFNEAIRYGLIPQLEMPDPTLSGEIEIATKEPMVAIKQYEAVLSAGFTPKFTKAAAHFIEAYVKRVMTKNKNNKQIDIGVAFHEDGKPNIVAILERIKQATKDGFIVNISSEAKNALQAHLMESNNPIPPIVDLQKLPKRKQLEQAKALVGLGINVTLSPFSFSPEQPIEVCSSNTAHACVIYGNLLRQGFEPSFVESLADQKIAIPLQDEKDLARLMKYVFYCTQNGFFPQISEAQREQLMTHIKVQRIKDPMKIGVGHFESMTDNLTLSQQLDLRFEIEGVAAEAYRQGKEKYTQETVPTVELQAYYKMEKPWFFGLLGKPRKVFDDKKTTAHAQALIAREILVKQSEKLQGEMQSVSDKIKTQLFKRLGGRKKIQALYQALIDQNNKNLQKLPLAAASEVIKNVSDTKGASPLLLSDSLTTMPTLKSATDPRSPQLHEERQGHSLRAR